MLRAIFCVMVAKTMKTVQLACPWCSKANRVDSRQLESAVACEHCRKPLLDGKTFNAGSDNFDAIIRSSKPVVVYFWGTWCGPCKTFSPIFDKVAGEKGKTFRFLKIDSQKHKALCNRYRIRGVPTLMVFKKGKQRALLNGALKAREFKQWLADALD